MRILNYFLVQNLVFYQQLNSNNLEVKEKS